MGHLRTQNRVFTSLPDFNPRRKTCHLRTHNPSKFMYFLRFFQIVVNFLPFALVDPGPADSNAGFGGGAAGGAQPRDHGAAGEGDLGEVTFPDVDEFDVRYVHGYGKVANVEAGMVFLEDRSGLLHWKIFRGISVRPLGAKTAGGREAAGDAVTLICPFWAKSKKGQEEKVFLVPFLYMRPPSSHTWALLCTQDELGKVQKVRGVPLSEIAGVLPGTREVGGVDQSAALLARVEAFWLRWEKEARSDMVRKVEAEARKVAEAIGEDVASESSAGGKSSVLPAKRARGRPSKVPAKVPGVSPAGQTSELVRQRSENELLKGKVALLEEQVREGCTAGCCAWREAAGGCAAEGAGRPAAGGAQHGHEGRGVVANPGEEAPGRAGGCAWAAWDEAHRSRGFGCAGGCRGGQGLADAVCR